MFYRTCAIRLTDYQSLIDYGIFFKSKEGSDPYKEASVSSLDDLIRERSIYRANRAIGMRRFTVNLSER